MSYDYSRAKESLSTIAVVKQDVYEHSYTIFDKLRTASQEAESILAGELSKIDARISIEFKDVNRNEFWLQAGGDLLIFSLHTNVFSFDRLHSLYNTNYVQEDHSRAYFCMIEVFNFLSDSVKYDRYRDIGEMVARIFVNRENHFFIEGIGAVGSLYSDLPTQTLDATMIDQVIETCITSSVNYDLWAPAFNDVRFIPLQAIFEKNGNSPRTTSKRLGFEIS
jgi:hypothetical protein